MSALHSDLMKKTKTLLISPHFGPPIERLQQLMGGQEYLDLAISNPVKVQGAKRGILNRLRYYWFDPILSMLRMLPSINRYDQIICWYHRTGYWVGIYRRLFSRGNPSRSVWVGFAPVAKPKGARGWVKEFLIYSALRGHSLIICNSKPLIESIKKRFPLVKDKLAFVRWGGGPLQGNEQTCQSSNDRQGNERADGAGYVFCGGRTNRDFETVLTAVGQLGCSAVFAVAKDYKFKGNLPENVRIFRDITSEKFQQLVVDAGVVVIALDRPDVSSGQVVLFRAMQSAKPIIVTRTAGIDDYVTDGIDALLVQPHNSTDLAEKIRIVMTDKEVRRKLSESSREKYRTSFNSDRFAQDVFAVLSEVNIG